MGRKLRQAPVVEAEVAGGREDGVGVEGEAASGNAKTKAMMTPTTAKSIRRR